MLLLHRLLDAESRFAVAVSVAGAGWMWLDVVVVVVVAVVHLQFSRLRQSAHALTGISAD